MTVFLFVLQRVDIKLLKRNHNIIIYILKATSIIRTHSI